MLALMAKAMAILIYFAPILGNFSMSNHWWHAFGQWANAHIPYASARLIYADNSSEFSINFHSALKIRRKATFFLVTLCRQATKLRMMTSSSILLGKSFL